MHVYHTFIKFKKKVGWFGCSFINATVVTDAQQLRVILLYYTLWLSLSIVLIMPSAVIISSP